MTREITGEHSNLTVGDLARRARILSANPASTMHLAAVNPGYCDVPIRAFGTFTHDLLEMAEWFKACGVTSVEMESTSACWIPAYEVLEQHGFQVILVNARYAKNVPGRKTDVSDAAWLRQLHAYGLLRGSFTPEAEIATLRAYLRQRERLVKYSASHIQHMQNEQRRKPTTTSTTNSGKKTQHLQSLRLDYKENVLAKTL